MALRLLSGHMQTQHGKEAGGRLRWEAMTTSGEPRTYRMALPTSEGPCNCPVEECTLQVTTRKAMQVHFFYWHVKEIIIILEEGNLPHSRCP